MNMSAAHPDQCRLETDNQRRLARSRSSHRRTHTFGGLRWMIHLHPRYARRSGGWRDPRGRAHRARAYSRPPRRVRAPLAR
jgi:hypothetical protein